MDGFVKFFAYTPGARPETRNKKWALLCAGTKETRMLAGEVVGISKG